MSGAPFASGMPMFSLALVYAVFSQAAHSGR